jgi:aminobenzoyl-glutamate transport protein
MAKEQRTGNMVQRALDTVERVGNRLPQPVTLFAILIVLVLAASWIISLFNVSVVHPGTQQTIEASNLLTRDGLQRILTQMVKTFTDFPPLGLVLVVMIGIGVAEKSGFIAAALRGFVASVPKKLITPSIITAGMLSSLAVDAGYVVLIPLGAVVFLGVGRHPIAGLAAAFAGVSGGFGANLFLTSLDPLLAGFTEPAARLMDPNYTVEATANWYFMAASVPVIAIAGTYVTERILEPRLGPYKGHADLQVIDSSLTPVEKKGLWVASVTGLAVLALIIYTFVPSDGILRGDDGSYVPLFSSIVPLLLFLFLVPGLAYGMVTGTIKGDKDVAKMMTEAMAGLGG